MFCLNGKEVKPEMFPDGTSQMWKIPEDILKKGSAIVWEFEDEAEVSQLAQLTDLVQNTNDDRGTLYMPYLPYSSQDGKAGTDEAFGLVTFSKILNFLSFKEILCLDPKSNKAEKLIKNFKSLVPSAQLDFALNMSGADIMCFPSEGAEEKYKEHFLDLNREICRGADPEKTFSDKIVLIVDNTCEDSTELRTLAQDLLTCGAKEVCLYATHGFFLGGLQLLIDSGISRIFTRKGYVAGGPIPGFEEVIPQELDLTPKERIKKPWWALFSGKDE